MTSKAFQRIYTKLEAITKATVSLKAQGVSNDELATVAGRLSQVVKIKGDLVTLQVFAGTAMAAEYDADPSRFRFWEVDEYIDLFIEILRRLRPDIVVERFASEAPPRYHYGRNWGLIRNETLLARLEKRLLETGAYQGEKFISL